MYFRSEVCSCASRPIMIWINEIESSKPIADLKTSYTVTGAKLQRVVPPLLKLCFPVALGEMT